MGIGTYLHVAFQVENGYITTSTKDRDYFHSRYITEPGGAIFECATMGPEFTLDEDPEEFGKDLRVPAWLDVERIEELLPPLKTD